MLRKGIIERFDESFVAYLELSIVQSPVKESILPHIVTKMLWKGIVERFDESFVAYLELGHYLLIHFEVVGQRRAKALKALKEARAETEKARTEVESMRNTLDDLGHDSSLPIDVDPLPHGVPIRPLIRSLKKEIHCLKKKLRKIEDDLKNRERMLRR
ncbi:hypothetical protein COCNU_scaffold010387G000010 [Cocos nucifera]|nr:hypothetical protein [Cocos nucifera]